MYIVIIYAQNGEIFRFAKPVESFSSGIQGDSYVILWLSVFFDVADWSLLVVNSLSLFIFVSSNNGGR